MLLVNTAPLFTANDTVHIADPNGLHFRAAGQLVRRLREEAPKAGVLLRRVSDGREVSTEQIELRTLSFLACVELGLRHGDEIAVETTGPAAEIALKIVHEELATVWHEEEYEDVKEWKSEGGLLHELADDRATWVLLEEADEEDQEW